LTALRFFCFLVKFRIGGAHAGSTAEVFGAGSKIYTALLLFNF
jgi:hypothetical protein